MNTKFTNIVLNVPHSSIEGYNVGWFGSVNLFPLVRRWTDWHTDILFACKHEKISMVRYGKSRFYCDVERLVNDPLEDIGQGIFYKKFDGFEREWSEGLYNEVMADYAAHLQRLSDNIISDDTLLIDCHSFPSDLSDVDICIGFNEDWSKPSDDVIDFLRSTFESHGYVVGVNEPYSNSVTPKSPFKYKSFMIEVNKRVYLDETTLMLKPTCAVAFKHLLERIYLSLLGENP